jgi:uncharacterized protein
VRLVCLAWLARRLRRRSKRQLSCHRTPNLGALLERAEGGDAAAVKDYFDAGGSAGALVYGRGAAAVRQMPLLHYIPLYNSHPHRELAEIVRLLVEAGADINAIGADGGTALMCASERDCCTQVLMAFLQNGANILASAADGKTALYFAAAAGRTDSCELLLERDNSLVNLKDDMYGFSPLMTAVKQNSIALVQLLLDNGADINVADNCDQNALFMAASQGRVSMMKLLVQHGLSVRAVNNIGSTPLSLAVSYGHKPAAEWLIQHGADVQASNMHGGTALHSACVNTDDPAMVELLLANGADVHKRAHVGQTALDMAARYGCIQCAKVLIAAGSDINNVLINGETGLHQAVTHKHSGTAQLLLEHGATAVLNNVINVECPFGEHCCSGLTALMMCSTVDTVKVLLAAGADVHVSVDDGETCLHKAARHALPVPVVCLLIKAGADLHAVNARGKTAARVAHINGNALIEQLLTRAAQQGR